MDESSRRSSPHFERNPVASRGRVVALGKPRLPTCFAPLLRATGGGGCYGTRMSATNCRARSPDRAPRQISLYRSASSGFRENGDCLDFHVYEAPSLDVLYLQTSLTEAVVGYKLVSKAIV